MEEKRIQGNSEWLAEFKLALKDEVPCEVGGCDDDAEWYMMYRCCNKVFLGCGGHCHMALRHLMSMAREGVIARCDWCGASMHAMSYMTRPHPLKLQA